ncbi:hypothetical protein ACFOWX_08950 [Sphingorhabdus arenilitoris]|uniref:Uncharacterized protein n=1 Tax=Sphingorhabdus arenilitoris TaxID=1490041 RepID=A0ABV8RH56_9SPHN
MQIAKASLPPHIRAIIAFDMLACGLFALPQLSALVIAVLNDVNGALGFAGQPVILAPAAFFFVNFAGLLGVALNAMLLKTSDAALHRVNVAARAGVVILLGYYILAHDLPAIFAAFILSEIVGGALTWRWLASRSGDAS